MLSRSFSDWSPFIDGKDAKQVWVTDIASGQSKYYLKSGPIYIGFSITDPGVPGKPSVGLMKPDWMKACNDAGYAKYVGREQARVENKDEWVDHWSCTLPYTAANQTITFQIFHSLGLNPRVAEGAPLAGHRRELSPEPEAGLPAAEQCLVHEFHHGRQCHECRGIQPAEPRCLLYPG